MTEDSNSLLAGGGVMGGLRRKRALLKKVTSFNLYADQWAQNQAIMEGSKAEKEAPVLRELIDEALGSRRRKFVRHDQEEETQTANVEVEALEIIRLLMVELLQQSTTSLRANGVNLGLLEETLAEARAGRRRLWESLVVPSLRERGYSAEEISNLFEEDTARAKDFAYALAAENSQ
jgi:hypothetical protein